MALGKRSDVTNDVAPQKGKSKLVGDVIAAGGDADDVIGGDGGPTMKKYGQHNGDAAHAGAVPHAGERLQGNVGDHPHYADQE